MKNLAAAAAAIVLLLASQLSAQTIDWGSGRPGIKVVTNETDSAALNTLATNRVMRLYSSHTNWSEYTGSNVMLRYEIIPAPAYTTVSFSADFEVPSTHETLYPATLGFPFETGGWIGSWDGSGRAFVQSPAPTYTVWIDMDKDGNIESFSGTGSATLTEHTDGLVTNVTPFYMATSTPVTLAAQEWLVYTNIAGQVTLTNLYEAPILLYGTGAVSVSWSGLRSPRPVYFVARGMSSMMISGAHFVGGASWQTNMSNHFVVWSFGTNLFINPLTTSED